MLQKIIPYFEPYLAEGICIAFSGGADSSLLLKAACLARETAAASDPSAQVLPILAVIAQTPASPPRRHSAGQEAGPLHGGRLPGAGD